MRLLFATTALLGAFLLFLVEPMFARMVLPLLGGAPAVWNTCLVFYQLALLAGYLYAHLAGRRPPRQQVILQIAIVAVAGVLLPIAIRGSVAPPATASPIPWVFRILVTSIGLPFVVLATTGPLLQRWFALLGNRAGGSPYSLFAASNVGSFVALLGYPFFIEPLLRLRTQSMVWSLGYAAYGLLIALCGAAIWRVDPQLVRPEPVARTPPAQRVRRGKVAVPAEPEDDPWAARLRWLGLAAIPSSLMMSVTTFISTDVGSVPLLWVVPLALYLLTFVLAFAERQPIPRRAIAWLFPPAVVLIVALVIAPPVYPVTMIVLHLTAFFIVALACHMELAASRPPAESLTEFYLWLSGGGAIGGMFNALLAPLIFLNPFEYPLAALSACLLLPNALQARDDERPSSVRRIGGFVVVAVPLLMVAGLVLFVQRYDASLPSDPFSRYAIIFLPPCLAAFLMVRAPLRMGVALATIVVAGAFVRFDNRVPIHLERSFFGVHRVLFSGHERVLLSGTTNHGAQSIDPALKCEPLTYYSRKGPVGQLLSAATEGGATKRFGVVGLGTASLAAYAAPGQRWTFFEINPVVERIARDPEYFTYLRDCAPDARIVTGDARLMLVDEPDSSFDVLLLDAFSSDAIPVHLMTLEAMELYFRKLAPGGLLAVHVSNRYLDLAPVVGATAQRAGLVAVMQVHSPSPDQRAISTEISPSRWVVVARGRADLGPLAAEPRWQLLDGSAGPVWTDDYSNVLGVLRH